jgi:peroxiredoxin
MTRCVFLMLAATLALSAQAGKTSLKIGDTAPDFQLSSSTGKPIKLSDFRGKQSVVLAFFPAAFTGGCTKEMTAYTAEIAKFKEHGAQVLAISTDNQPTLNHWAGELKSDYPYVSDFQRKVSAEYGVLIPERGIANRTTFVIDKEGKIQHIDEGNAAVDINGAATACSRINKKS